MLIGGDKKMIVYDDLQGTEKVKIYDTGYDIKSDEDKRRIMYDYRTGDIFVPRLDTREALYGMAADFVKALTTGSKPVSDYELGLNIVKILEASQYSIKNKGCEVQIK